MQAGRIAGRGCVVALAAVGALVVLIVVIAVVASSNNGNAPTSPTTPGNATTPSAPAPKGSTPPASTSAACQLMPTIKSAIAKSQWDAASRDAGHASNLASDAGNVTESLDFNTLSADLIVISGSSPDMNTVNADLATLADDCK